MESVIQIGRHRVFSLDEAREILPLIKSFTAEASREVDGIVRQLEALPVDVEPSIGQALEDKVNHIIEVWQGKVERLGATHKGLWIVDFDFGSGYYCWKYPEPDILHWHEYDHGFISRKKVEKTSVAHSI